MHVCMLYAIVYIQLYIYVYTSIHASLCSISSGSTMLYDIIRVCVSIC